MDRDNLPILKAEERVLSTLESDGSRHWLTPMLSTGRFWVRRRVVAYVLIAIYTLLPFIKIGGRPAMQFDLWNGRFSFFGLVFLPNELKLLALFGLIVVLSIFFATAIFGRVWCGWGCPQTVYMEYVFRPIERFFTGTTGRGGTPRREVAGWRRVTMYLIYLLVCLHLSNTFLAYFVGVDQLHAWIWTAPPWQHPAAFALVVFVTGLMMFDFCYWREQLCIIGCPYGRFQSVMLDSSSLVVGYDRVRGEPRGRGRDREAKNLGSCVDCHLCVDVCPTGIDIRDGLQMECVNCTQCIDVCDEVMDRTHQPRGLIRYSSQAEFEGQPTHIVRPRVLVYSGLLLGLVVLFSVLLASRSPFHITLLRGMGRPFVVQGDGQVENLVNIKVFNRSDREQTYSVSPVDPVTLSIAGTATLTIPAQGAATEPLHLIAPITAFAEQHGMIDARLRVTDSDGATIEQSYRLFGPATAE